ncbi:MAG: L-histidine N(alpha)-methyltransferase [Actinomycetota bacterium]|nr:L-histidine N(alpha)-methyltransferase [Actinomycetota bacterium]
MAQEHGVRTETLGEAEEAPAMARNVREGLLATPKDLSPWPKYFYDAEGSRLFEEITSLPEYYQARTEFSILQEKAGEIVAQTRCRELVELGPGSANKAHALLDAMLDANRSNGSNQSGGAGIPARYVPFDVSEDALRASVERVLDKNPTLEVAGFAGDFERSLGEVLGEPRDPVPGRLVIFLGGTIGNFAPERRRSFLSEVRAGLRPGDHFLVGVDLVKDRETLEAAYNDSAGITARFNKNLLKVLNENLGGTFDLGLFTHRAFYEARKSRIEMWLYSTIQQTVAIRKLNFEVCFGAGEGMRTEISTKFTRESAEGMLAEAGFAPVRWYTDEKELFGLALGRAGVHTEEE